MLIFKFFEIIRILHFYLKPFINFSLLDNQCQADPIPCYFSQDLMLVNNLPTCQVPSTHGNKQQLTLALSFPLDCLSIA